jgi:hypothetical protein
MSVALGGVGHGAVDGSLPDLGPTALFAALVAVLVGSVAPGAGGLRATVARLGAGQLLLHLVLSATTLHHASAVAGTGAVMLAVHVTATVVGAVALTGAHHGIAALVGALRHILPLIPLSGIPVPAAPGVQLPRKADRAPVATVLLRSAVIRRGPPAPG